MEILKQILGRLHPLIVHLPIGFILAALLLQWTDRKKKSLALVISKLFLWAAISAVLACITGYLQYLGEGYAFATVKKHLWLGIVTAVFSFVMYFRLKPLDSIKWIKSLRIPFLSVLLLLLITYTGHLGGSITHGEDYLVEPLPNNLKAALGYETYEKQPIVLNEEHWQEAQLYPDVIAPILNNNCVSCHNKKRAKGELILNSMEAIESGGENGAVIVPGDAEESPLFYRLVLPEDDEDHMPPKDKPQPTKEEIAIIRTWISLDAPSESTLGDLGLSKKAFASFFPKKRDNYYPDVNIEGASLDSINKIKSLGVHVQSLSHNSNFLTVSCINKPEFSDKDFKSLLAIRNHITELDLGGTKVTDAIFKELVSFKYLTKLKIDNTSISGSEIKHLESLEYLKDLNLTGTLFKKSNLAELYRIKGLRTVYLFNTGLKHADNRENRADSTLVIEFGNYELPKRASDSIIY